MVIMELSQYSETEQRHHWANTSVSQDGYLMVTVPPQYLETINILKSKVGDSKEGFLSQQRLDYRIPAPNMPYGQLIETKNRTTFFFGSADDLWMLTVWNWSADGARLTLFREFLNVDVDGEAGTLSLAVSPPRSAKVMWRLNWIAGATHYELWKEDKLNSEGRPSLDHAAILAMGASLMKINSTSPEKK